VTTPTDWVGVTAACGRCSAEGGDIAWVFRNLSPQQRDILIGADTSRPMPYYLCQVCWDLTFEGEEE